MSTPHSYPMLDSYDSSFSEYCSYCERRIIDGNGLYCSEACKLKDLYVNTSSQDPTYSQYYDSQLSPSYARPAGSITSPLSTPNSNVATPANGASNYYDYSLSAINDANSLTSRRASSSGTRAPLNFASAAHYYYRESAIKGIKTPKDKYSKQNQRLQPQGQPQKQQRHSYSQQLAPKLSPESAAYWKSVQSKNNSFR